MPNLEGLSHSVKYLHSTHTQKREVERGERDSLSHD